ncbi:MAG: hypothetical protein ABR598_07730 [Candidatus Dormibacteria bacterium]
MRFPHQFELMPPGVYERDAAGKVVVDDAGWPIEADDVEGPYPGWIQPSPTPKRIKDVANPEIMANDESGEAFTSHLLFAPFHVRRADGTLKPLVIRKRARIRRVPHDGLEYVAASDAQDAGGRGHHQEVDLVEYRYPVAP